MKRTLIYSLAFLLAIGVLAFAGWLHYRFLVYQYTLLLVAATLICEFGIFYVARIADKEIDQLSGKEAKDV